MIKAAKSLHLKTQIGTGNVDQTGQKRIKEERGEGTEGVEEAKRRGERRKHGTKLIYKKLGGGQ